MNTQPLPYSRRSGLAVLLSLILASTSSSFALQVFQETGGLVSMEAENASARISAISRDWLDIASAPASGGIALQASPDGGAYSNTTASPRAAYQVNFTQTGVYYLWVRITGPSTSSDSVHVGYKNSLLTTAGGLTASSTSGYFWDNTEGSNRITFNVASPGIHSVDLWMREDGVIVDKLVVTQDPAFTPAGTGPVESERVERPVISSSATASGSGGTLFTYHITAPQPVDNYSASGLPAGLVLDPATGEIEGRPTPTGTFNATITATNRAGSDTNPLTISITAAPAPITTTTAFKTALGAAVPGSVIVLANGTYTNFGYFKHIKSGTATQPVMIRAQTPGGVIFNGNFQLEVQAGFIVIDGFRVNGDQPPSPDYTYPAASSGIFKIHGNDNRLTECSIEGFNRIAGATKWVQIKGDHHRVDHCHFSDKVGSGQMIEVILDGTADYHRIDHNVFRDFAYGGGANEHETLRVGSGSLSIGVASITTVEKNYFDACDGEIETISVKSSDCTVRDNTLVNCRGTITLRQGKRNVVTGNVLLNLVAKSESGGIRVCNSDHEIRDNYIYGARTSGSQHMGGIVITASDVDPAADPSTYAYSAHWPVKNVVVQNNSLINCKQSFVHGGGYAYNPVSTDFIDNCARNNIAGNGQFNIARVIRAITTASYAGERYYGSASGLSPLPAGIDAINDPALSSTVVNGYTFYFAPGGAGTDATHLHPLQSTDVGPPGYTP